MDTISGYITESNIDELLLSGATNLLIALTIFLIGRWVARMAQNTLEKILRKQRVDDVLVDFHGTIASALGTGGRGGCRV